MQDPFSKLMVFIEELERAAIHYRLDRHRENSIMVVVAVPGERWEVEFLADGSIEVEKFISEGEIYGEEALVELLAEYADRSGNGHAQPSEMSVVNAD
jgi:hypothetical protein